MNDNKVTLTPAEREQIDAWLSEIRAIYADVAAPFTENDSRMAAFPKGYPLDGLDADGLGSMYFHVTKPELPAWPLALPAWAERVEVLAGNYPEVAVRFIGKSSEVGSDDGTRFSARIEQFGTVFADTDDSPAEPVIERGSYEMGEPLVCVPEHGTDLSAGDALMLALAILDAGQQLRDFLDS